MQKKTIPSWILSSKEEKNLSEDERKEYYEKLRAYCKNRKLTNTTWGATTVAPKLKKATGAICRKVCNILAGGDVEIVVDGLENIPAGPVIFTSTHQGILDNLVWIQECPKHSLIFHGIVKNKALLLAQVNTGLILVAKEKTNVQNRTKAKLDLMSVLLNNHSVFIFPETTWNFSPNRLHLPLNYGFLDVARKTNIPVVPVVMEYTYHLCEKKERITRIHIRYGETFVVGEQEELVDKLEEFGERISTIRWELIEEKGLYKRNEMSNWEYINIMEDNLLNLKAVQADINMERIGIQGANQEFYVFHHINDVP